VSNAGPYRVSCALRTRASSGVSFAVAARSYWLDVFPVVRRELRRLRIEAGRIPDPTLRRLALESQAVKWSSLEGAAAFAAFVPRALRAAVVRLLVGYQAVYDYADILMEQPCDAPAANGRQLHSSLTAIVEPDRPHPDYYRHHRCDRDGGYLVRMVDRCRAVVSSLPTYRPMARAIIESAERGIEYQCRISLSTERDHPMLREMAAQAVPDGSLRWWETWAACGSSLLTLALLAAAADPATSEDRANAIEALYWPWAGALHALLDCLIDYADDAAGGRPNLLDLYESPRETAERMGVLASESVRLAALAGTEHRLIVAGMASVYISDAQAWVPASRLASESILDALGELATPSMLVLRARRLAHHRSA
jgi:tetraprenyl-beta-curcumene synthase